MGGTPSLNACAYQRDGPDRPVHAPSAALRRVIRMQGDVLTDDALLIVNVPVVCRAGQGSVQGGQVGALSGGLAIDGGQADALALRG